MRKLFLAILTVFLILSCISKPPAASNDQEQLQRLLINTDVIAECMALIRPLSDYPNELIDLIFAFSSAHPTEEILRITLNVSKTLYGLSDKIQRIDMDIAEYAKLNKAYINGDSSVPVADLMRRTEIILEKINSLQPDIDAFAKVCDTLDNAMRRYNFEFTP